MELCKLLFAFQMIHHNDVMQKIKEIYSAMTEFCILSYQNQIGAPNSKSKLVIAHSVSKERDKDAPGMYI